MESVDYVWPEHWPNHAEPHWTSCLRCILECEWFDDHEDCHCVDKPWDRVDVGSPAVPALQWVCSVCLVVQGPAYAGGVACNGHGREPS